MDNGNDKKATQRVLLFLVTASIIVILVTIGLLIYDNYKYKTYKAMPADLLDFEKVYNNGVSEYQGTYKYIVNKKEYFYKYPHNFKERPDQVIQIKYDKNNPNDVHNDNDSKILFIVLITSIGVMIFLIVVTIAVSPSKLEQIVTVQVIEFVNCVGGRRIYLNDINIPKESPDFLTKKYYVYFSDDNKKFEVGNVLTFNKYKYGEALTLEDYRNVKAQTVYNFKNEDFTVIKKV